MKALEIINYSVYQPDRTLRDCRGLTTNRCERDVPACPRRTELGVGITVVAPMVMIARLPHDPWWYVGPVRAGL
jgi:hypothetical protein